VAVPSVVHSEGCLAKEAKPTKEEGHLDMKLKFAAPSWSDLSPRRFRMSAANQRVESTRSTRSCA